MKVLLVNGSPHKEGCTYAALCEVADTLQQEGIETEIFWIGNKPVGGCIACKACTKSGKCVFDDVVNRFREKAYEADGFIFGSPVHYAGAAGEAAEDKEGLQGMGEFQNMLHAALNTGIDPIAIKEVIYQAAAYLGIGRTYDFLTVANQTMEQHGIKLPPAPQATTNEKTRFEDGLTKQVELFGSDMAKRQTDVPVFRRNINRWLADNCFGDYYTWNGLNAQEREMIMFCFIPAQYGCENQFCGHTAGNLEVARAVENQ